MVGGHKGRGPQSRLKAESTGADANMFARCPHGVLRDKVKRSLPIGSFRSASQERTFRLQHPLYEYTPWFGPVHQRLLIP